MMLPAYRELRLGYYLKAYDHQPQQEHDCHKVFKSPSRRNCHHQNNTIPHEQSGQPGTVRPTKLQAVSMAA